MIRHLRNSALRLLGVCALVAAPLAVANVARAGDCCVPQPKVMRSIVVRSPECCTVCTTINVCLPACVADQQPCISSRPALFGKGVVHLSWSGGPTVSVRFTNHGPRVFYH